MRTEWHDALGRHCPRFSLDREVMLSYNKSLCRFWKETRKMVMFLVGFVSNPNFCSPITKPADPLPQNSPTCTRSHRISRPETHHFSPPSSSCYGQSWMMDGCHLTIAATNHPHLLRNAKLYVYTYKRLFVSIQRIWSAFDDTHIQKSFHGCCVKPETLSAAASCNPSGRSSDSSPGRVQRQWVI